MYIKGVVTMIKPSEIFRKKGAETSAPFRISVAAGSRFF
jgi:hypothetical protein